MSYLFARKRLSDLIQEAEENRHGFRRHLSAWNLVLIGVGCIIGAGIFVLTGSAAANFAGPSLVVSFLLSAIGCAFAGLFSIGLLGAVRAHHGHYRLFCRNGILAHGYLDPSGWVDVDWVRNLLYLWQATQ